MKKIGVLIIFSLIQFFGPVYFAKAQGYCNKKTDVMFAIDTTSSMGSIINAVKTQASNIMTELDLELGAGNVKYGLVEFRDYGDTPNPYEIEQSLTLNKNDVQTKLNGLSAGGGNDLPEAYGRVMYESYNNYSAFGWRNDASKFLIMMGDDEPHNPIDCSDRGCDPAVDDITLATALGGMETNSIVLISLHSGSFNDSWQDWAQVTGGDSYAISTTSPGDLADVIRDAVLEVVGDMDKDGYISKICGGDDCDDSQIAIYPGRPCFNQCFENTLKSGICQNTGECSYNTVLSVCENMGDSCKLDFCQDNETVNDFCVVDASSNICGGIVPCGRVVNNPGTGWDETQSCSICHLVILANNIIDLLIKLAGIVALLAIVIGGFFCVTSSGDTSLMSSAKNGITKALWGFAIIFVTWVVINVLMVLFGFIDPLGDGSWNKFTCNF